MASNMELMMNHIQKPNDNGLMVFSNGSFTQDHDHHPQLQIPPINFTADNSIQSFPSLALMGGFNHEYYSHGKTVESFVNLSPPPPPPPPHISGSNKCLNGRKRKRNNEKEKMVEKPKEVIHVRAKRGQATDSHSLAERVRREKINERLRSLQDLVPGCYKTMGMAVMLDVIINYVQSLQNQIEFLSMKLSAASMYYDFNLEPDITDTFQGTNGHEVQEETERMVKEGYGGPSHFHSTWSL